MAIDFLMSTSDDGKPPPQHPTLAEATYSYDREKLTLRELARRDEIPVDLWKRILSLCVEEQIEWSGPTIYRQS